VRGDRNWRYVGVTHEYIECDGPATEAKLDAIVIHHHADGTSWGHKFERDKDLLEQELARDPGNPRTVFYLAQTYRDMGRQAGDDPDLLQHAANLYERRAALPGWDEETYCAIREAGNLHAALGNWPAAMEAFIRAWEFRPSRLEAVHDLASGLNQRRRYHAAYRLTSLAVGAEPLRPPDDSLFLLPWVYEWGLLFQHSIAAYWCGDYDASVLACRRLLGIAALPEEYREQTKLNLEYAVKGKAQVVFDRTLSGSAR
jgi:tetratricopeptide (TPR) repeat protein